MSKYMALEDGDPEKRFLEQRYGIANLRRLVAKYKEDEANRQWFAQSTMACPSCHVKVQKSVGCNHVRSIYLLCFLHVSLTDVILR